MTEENRYKITELIRKSRTGGIYKATDTKLEREIAMRRFFTDDSKPYLENYHDNFITESASLGKIQHPNIRSWYDAGIDSDGPYLTSQSQVGNLIYDKVSKDGKLSEDEVYKMAQQLLEAFLVIHKVGYTHGALTTRSIAYTQKNLVSPRFQLIDLGLNQFTKIIFGEEYGDIKIADPTITAPELFKNYTPNASSDLFSIGQILYICLAGGHPFAEVAVNELQQQHAENKMPPLSKYINVSLKFEKWIHSLIQADPSKRPESAQEALNSLAIIKINKKRIEKKPIPAINSSSDSAQSAVSHLNTTESSHLNNQTVVQAQSKLGLFQHNTISGGQQQININEQIDALNSTKQNNIILYLLVGFAIIFIIVIALVLMNISSRIS